MKSCAFEGCAKEARSRGYCQTHYMRIHRHGTASAGRPEWYGTKANHPLYVTHKAAKQIGALCEPWMDFWRFVEDVSPVPEGDFRLHRIDSNLPYSKENCEWRESRYTKDKYSESQLKSIRNEVRKENARDSHDPVKHRQRSLKSNHGITVDQYQEMHDAQGGKCDICGKPETKTGGRSKGILPLSVDHCHKTRQSGASKGIRGLLCQACNIGLGKFDDDPELLRRAAAYLEKYRN